jgi:hypothetical protein
MKGLKGIVLFLVVVAILQSCTAWMPYQRIKAETQNPNVTLTINGNTVVEGDKVVVRRKKPVVISGYRYGYRTRSEMFYPKRINTGLLLSGSIFAISLIGGADPAASAVWGSFFVLDAVSSPRKHRKTYTLGEMEKMPSNPTPSLMVWGDKGLDEIPVANHQAYKFSKAKKFEEAVNGESIVFENNDRIDTLSVRFHVDGLLETMGYQTESKGLFASYEHNLFLDADIKNLTRHELPIVGHRHIVDMTWRVLDFYGKELYSLPVTAASQVFSVSSYYDEGIEDAIYVALNELLDDKGFKKVQQDVLNLQNQEMSSLSDIELPGGSSKVSSKPSDLVHSQVSLLTEDSHGSACVISPDGHLLATYGIVEQNDKMEVQFSNGVKKWATVLRKDPITNVALLKADTSGVAFIRPVVSATYNVGDEVVAVSSPVSKKLSQTYSTGIISAERNANGVDYIQTDVKVSFGSNGSPLINSNGELIGLINEKKLGNGIEGLSFAVSSTDIMNRLKIKYTK